MKRKPCTLKVSIYRLGQSREALFQQYKSYLQLMAKSWPHEKKKVKINNFPFCTFISQDTIPNDRLFIIFTRDKAVHMVSQAVPGTVWCHLLRYGALIRKL